MPKVKKPIAKRFNYNCVSCGNETQSARTPQEIARQGGTLCPSCAKEKRKNDFVSGGNYIVRRRCS